jgi:hypothetical protein
MSDGINDSHSGRIFDRTAEREGAQELCTICGKDHPIMRCPERAPDARAQGDVVERMLAAWHEQLMLTNQPDAMTAAYAVARAEVIARLASTLRIRLNNHLIEMKPEHDDSICGFNEAQEIVNEALKDALAQADKPRSRVTVVGAIVFVDGKEYAVFKGHDSHEPAERYAAGLRAELEKQ